MFLVDWAVKMRIRPPEFETSICDAKYHVSLALSVIPRGSWGDVARRSYRIRWAKLKQMDQLFVYGSSDINILRLLFFLFRKVPLEKFDPQTQSPSLAPGELLDFTPALGCVTHLFYAYVRKATNTEFNVFVLGRDLILHFGFEIHSLYNIAQLSRI
ncbi:hypothetical protein F511_22133 [Dorcoceras hygrometricum]|uniref:Uncharacterized protein n=1 Tax=Dorcoceras hygrometricum TaxID=472368 RepID=A0A2Z7AW79_9LAMI|nr:hypothetical protein F511_22133 [Dorcoceras hygrometricum]